MFRILVTLIVTLYLFLPAAALDAPEIIVAGKGVVMAEADVAYVNVAIEQTEKNASQAQQKAANIMKGVLAALEKAGIPKGKIQTTSFRLDPKYQYDKGQRNLIGYTASNQIKVTLDDLSAVGKIIDTSISAGANNINNVTFTIKDEEPQKKQALKQAFNNAREKARAIAQAAKIQLKKIKQIQESGTYVVPPAVGLRALKAEGVGGSEVETPIVPGKVEVRGNLTVVYECVK